jgi:predicted porin
MKKKLLIAAVGAALVAGPMVAAHAAGATLYGHFHMSLDRFDNDTDAATAERGFLSSNSSRFGIKGDEDLGGGLKALYQVESGGFNADTGATGFGGTLRNTFVGFAGSWGTVKLGRHDTPYKDLGRKLDNFNEQIGDARNIIGSGLNAAGDAANFNWDQRVSNMVRYDSPSFGGLTVAYQYATDEGAISTPTGAATGDVNSLGLNWSSGPFWAGFAYETHKTVSADNETGMRLAGSYTMNDLTFGLFWEDLSDLGGSSDAEHGVMGLMAAMKMGNNKFKFHWYNADDYDAPGGSADGTGGSLWAIGVDHVFSKTAMVYLNYAKADNDSDADYINTASSNGGHGNTIAVGDVDTSPTAFSAGYILKF